MKAVLQEQHGSAEVLSIGEADSRSLVMTKSSSKLPPPQSIGRISSSARETTTNHPGTHRYWGSRLQGLSTSWVLEYQASRLASE